MTTAWNHKTKFLQKTSLSLTWLQLLEDVNCSDSDCESVKISKDFNISLEKMKNCLQSLKISKAAGSDNFPPHLLNNLLGHSLVLLLHQCNFKKYLLTGNSLM